MKVSEWMNGIPAELADMDVAHAVVIMIPEHEPPVSYGTLNKSQLTYILEVLAATEMHRVPKPKTN